MENHKGHVIHGSTNDEEYIIGIISHHSSSDQELLRVYQKFGFYEAYRAPLNGGEVALLNFSFPKNSRPFRPLSPARYLRKYDDQVIAGINDIACHFGFRFRRAVKFERVMLEQIAAEIDKKTRSQAAA